MVCDDICYIGLLSLKRAGGGWTPVILVVHGHLYRRCTYTIAFFRYFLCTQERSHRVGGDYVDDALFLRCLTTCFDF